MASINNIKIGDTTYEIWDNINPIISSNLVSSPSSIYLYSWGNRIFHLTIFYNDFTLYSGSQYWRTGKIGGQNTTWKIQNKCSYVRGPYSNSTMHEVYGMGLTNYQGLVLLINLHTDGQVFFEQKGGSVNVPTTTAIDVIGNLFWLGNHAYS